MQDATSWGDSWTEGQGRRAGGVETERAPVWGGGWRGSEKERGSSYAGGMEHLICDLHWDMNGLWIDKFKRLSFKSLWGSGNCWEWQGTKE